MRFSIKNLLPHLVAVGILLFLCAVYFYPMLGGKVLEQHDTVSALGWQAETKAFYEKDGKAPLWSNGMFSGMPTYQTWGHHFGNWFVPLYRIFTGYYAGVSNPLGTVLLCMLSMYILLSVLGARRWWSLAGAAVFGLSTINAILIDAGHINKIIALGFVPAFMAGLILIYRGKYAWGALLTAVSFCCEIIANHYQITLYLLLLTLVFGVSELIQAARLGRFLEFLRATAVAFLAVVIGLAPNIGSLLTNYEYAEATIRGKAILSKAEVGQEAGTSGLDKEYAYHWSYGVGESINLLIPNAYGGSSTENIGENSATYKAIKQQNPQQARSFVKQAPTYWGEQPGVSGPFYFGAIVLFLAVLGIIVSRHYSKWWLLAGMLLFVMIAWGKNFAAFNYFLFDHFPTFNKFRAFTSSLSMAHLCAVALAALALRELFYTADDHNQLAKKTLYVGGAMAAFCLLLALLGGAVFDFSGATDANFKQYAWLLQALEEDRAAMLRNDALRSAVLIALSAGALWLYLKGKMRSDYVIAAVVVLMLGDMWQVSKRYQNADDFKSAKKSEVRPTAADEQIMKDKTLSYRVLDLTSSPFNDSRGANFHKLIGGYHAAKLRRYQDIIEEHISQNNQSVLNMLNTKYIITQDGKIVPNPAAAGNAWLVSSYEIVPDADTEISRLKDFNPQEKAFIHKEFETQLAGLNLQKDSIGSIALTQYHPDRLTYQFKANSEQLVLFSEMWYDKGWKAYIDDKETPLIRANYVLRALRVPAGEHRIELKFEPENVAKGTMYATVGSVFLLLLILGAAVQLWREKV